MGILAVTVVLGKRMNSLGIQTERQSCKGDDTAYDRTLLD